MRSSRSESFTTNDRSTRDQPSARHHRPPGRHVHARIRAPPRLPARREDTVNNKPNYRSVMSYSRQFSGSPITGRRLDYSRSELDLTEASLERVQRDRVARVRTRHSAPIPPYLPLGGSDRLRPGRMVARDPIDAATVQRSLHGWPGARSTGTGKPARAKVFQTATSGDINGDGVQHRPVWINDWANVLYRFSAAIDFAGGRSETLFSPGSTSEMTKEDETDFFLRKMWTATELAMAGTGWRRDYCGQWRPDHRVSLHAPDRHQAEFHLPRTINLGAEATVSIVIFSEKNGSSVWAATNELVTLTNGSTAAPHHASRSASRTSSMACEDEPEWPGHVLGAGLSPTRSPARKMESRDFKCQFATSGLPNRQHTSASCPATSSTRWITTRLRPSVPDGR